MEQGTIRAMVGWIWILVWGLTLWGICWPWAGLGFLLTDTEHWWLQASIWFGVPLGLFGGWHARDLSAQQPRRDRRFFLRRWHLPLGALVALALSVAWSVGGQPIFIAVLVRSLFALAAGFDVAYAAWPLACGEDYRVHASHADGRADDQPGLPWLRSWRRHPEERDVS